MRWMCVVVLASCGGGGELTCAVEADPGNCWAMTAAEAQACTPTTVGVLAADRTTCTFADGTVVAFDVALPQFSTDLTHLQFTVTGANGCTWGFHDFFANHLELTAGGHTDVVTLDGGTFTLACGTGGDYTANFDSLFTCSGDSRAPTDGYDVTATMFDFTISAVGLPSPLFTCMTR